MRLYHYTHPGTCLRIGTEGLLPGASEDNDLMTGGLPVVWLTRQESNVADAGHIEHMVKVVGHADRKTGDPMFGGTARLTVNLSRHDRRLIRYADFLRRAGMDFVSTRLHEGALTSWWVYLGIIPPEKVEPVTAATAVLCLDWHIETHPDVEARGYFKTQRERLAACRPDTVVHFACYEAAA
jgi:hypothetical protein